MDGRLERYAKQVDERRERQQRFALGDDGYRLFKAAPDLLAALEDMIDACEHWEDQNDPILSAAREAIAKAKGGE